MKEVRKSVRKLDFMTHVQFIPQDKNSGVKVVD